MKILYSMASLDPRKGGPSAAARSIATALAEHGHDVTLVGHDDGRKQSADTGTGYRTLLFPLTSRRWQHSRAYVRWVRRNITTFDAVIINSLFLSHTWHVSRAARHHKVPYSLRPHGSLNYADIQRSHPKPKRLYLRLIDGPALRGAKFIFCTSQAEADQAKEWTKAKCAVIPLGVHAAAPIPGTTHSRTSILFLGRITTKKGIDILLEALRLLKDRGLGFHAKIVGPSDPGLEADYKALANRLNLGDDVDFYPFAGGHQKAHLLATSGIFALPSEDENFGIAPAEAMAAGVPLVVTPGVSHAKAVARYNLGVVPQRTPSAVADALEVLLRITDKQWDDMSARAKDYATQTYDWANSARQITAAFGNEVA